MKSKDELLAQLMTANDALGRNVHLEKAIVNIQIGNCPTCGNPYTDFRDQLSIKKFRISRMCQSCQDKAFAPPLEDEEFFDPPDDEPPAHEDDSSQFYK